MRHFPKNGCESRGLGLYQARAAILRGRLATESPNPPLRQVSLRGIPVPSFRAEVVCGRGLGGVTGRVFDPQPHEVPLIPTVRESGQTPNNMNILASASQHVLLSYLYFHS